ncbi:MAG: sulfite exporter TauE/SafE family protein [Candidatus Eremiobacteraeota bacterium]|nr:sulfite exporter TauE/SafE family protein [Candidatus Eremiobacteraeota bacterium]MBV8498620.1 sulfite exporter TauE/SafE family protein [Candidatus Eremiobacteraeota bacterium]
MTERAVLYVGLIVVAIVMIAALALALRRQRGPLPKPLSAATSIAIGFVTNFFDTLGIGSFATTTSLYKFLRFVPDERIPGTLNVGHTLPTILEAAIFIVSVAVAPATLLLLIAASIVGAWLGAGFVARLHRRYVQIGMGSALAVAAVLFIMVNLKGSQFGLTGTALGLVGVRLWIGIFVSFCLGALMTIGIGLYAPCMIMVSLLGMNPIAAFPIMMGSCAFLMPVASLRFIRFNAFSMRAALGLTLGGIPGVWIAAHMLFRLPITAVRWLVVIVVLYAAVTMLRSAAHEASAGRASDEVPAESLG